MKVICIDTQIFSYAIVQKVPEERKDLSVMANDFLMWVQQEKLKVIVPSIVLGELLVAVPVEDHPDVLARFYKDYRVLPYDAACARQFAEIQRNHLEANKIKEVLNGKNPLVTRTTLKADTMIIATAITHGADKIYTNDKHMIKMAAGYIAAEDFKKAPFQRSLGL